MDYGIIGNCKSCALINRQANIDWFCYPAFSSPSVFARVLDKEKGGSFSISTKDRYKTKQKYIKDTNILETVFESDKAKFVVIDFFPRYRKLLPNTKKKLFRQNRLIRLIKPLKGKPVIRVCYDPRLDYARGETRLVVEHNNLVARNHVSQEKEKEPLSLLSNVDYNTILNEEYFELNHKKYFIIGQPDKPEQFNVTHCLRLMRATERYWKKWVSTLVLPEQNKDLIIRSALTLKLLTFSESGAVIAAATTSIPEEYGSERTWDYRYCWIRDASFAVDALKKIGRDFEAKKLMEFVFEQTLKKKQRMQIMYGVNGETMLTEKKLEHLAGYKQSRPVRIGNAAYKQKQNDIYGSIIEIIYLYYVFYEYEKKIPVKYWNFLKYLVGEIRSHWNEKDHGIWEFRGVKKHFTYSKLLCYVGVDRAVRIAQHYQKDKLAEDWAFLRDEIRGDILRKAWDENLRAFTMAYNDKSLDAAVLMMSYYNFLGSDDPRMVSTVRKIYDELRTGSLVRRYKIKDDFGMSGTSFTICAFWLVDALYTIGETKAARRIFKALTKRANRLGLFSEGISTDSKQQRGNFPQAYTHLALINTALLLSEWGIRRKKLSPYELPNNRMRLG